MTSKILLCSDLDRTLIPNGPQKESPQARPVLQQLAEQSQIQLVYVTGRHLALIRDAITEFRLPVPDYAVGDVGSTLYRVGDGHWKPLESWTRLIADDWNNLERHDLVGILEDIDEIELQELEKQSRYKLSYYTDHTVDHRYLVETIRRRLQAKGVNAAVIWSMDEPNNLGLLDILPGYATKLNAIKFFLRIKGIPEKRMVFAGDSGNDLDALTSGLQAVLVKNASEDVRQEALEILSRQQMTDCLYLARGDFLGMNGNYTAGVLEGLAHFFPEAEKWIRAAIK